MKINYSKVNVFVSILQAFNKLFVFYFKFSWENQSWVFLGPQWSPSSASIKKLGIREGNMLLFPNVICLTNSIKAKLVPFGMPCIVP
jgi:hypothetical protein